MSTVTKKWTRLLWIGIIIAALLVGCTNAPVEDPKPAATEEVSGIPAETSEQPTEEEPVQAEGLRIALSNSYIGNTWRAGMVNVYNAYCKKLQGEGVIAEFYSSSSGNEPQAQINEIRNMMSKGYDVILVDASSPTALVPVLEEAVERGIIIVAFDNTVESDMVYNVNTDRIQFGKLQAQWIADKLGGKGNIIMVKGIDGTQATIDARKGVDEVFANYPDIKIVAEGEGKWDDSTAAAVVNSMLAAHKSKGIDAVMSEGGDNGVIQALKQQGIDFSNFYMAAEMENGYWRAMKEDGIMGFSTGQPLYLVASAIDIAIKVANGEEVDKTTIVDLPAADYTQVDQYYAPGQPDTYFVSWSDSNNTFGLKLEDVYPAE